MKYDMNIVTNFQRNLQPPFNNGPIGNSSGRGMVFLHACSPGGGPEPPQGYGALGQTIDFLVRALERG